MTDYQVTVRFAVTHAGDLAEKQHLARLDRAGGMLATWDAALSTFPATRTDPQVVEVLMTVPAILPGEAGDAALKGAEGALGHEGYAVIFREVKVQTEAVWLAEQGIGRPGGGHDPRD